jgi:cytidylate kinase
MIITLSRQLGSSGDVIAARVAAALGLNLVDREVVYRAALAAGVPEEQLQKLMYRGVRSLAGEILDSLGATPDSSGAGPRPLPNPLGGLLAPMLMPASLDLEEVVKMIGLIVKDLASQGDVLVLGQGAQMSFKGFRGACHVQVLAPLQQRVARVVRLEGVNQGEARRLIRASDEARATYLARYYGSNWLDPLLYHLIINTGQTSVESAVSLIVHAALAVRTVD